MAKPTTTLSLPTAGNPPPAVSAPTPEVTLEVTEQAPISQSRPIIGIEPRPLFEVTVEDAPDVPAKTTSVPHVRQVSAKTLAEHAAGREMISQYGPTG